RPMMIGTIPLFILCATVLLGETQDRFEILRVLLCVVLMWFLAGAGDKAAVDLYSSRQSDANNFASNDRMLEGALKGKGEVTGVAPMCLSLPWRQYPVRVIWQGPDNLEGLKALDQAQPLDFLLLPPGHPIVYGSGLGSATNLTPTANWTILDKFRYTNTCG